MSTFRGKLGIAAFCVVLFITILFYLVFVHPRGEEIQQRARADLTRAATLVQRIQRLHAFDLVALAKEAAQRSDLVEGVQKESESERRQRVFESISEFDRKLREERRKAHFLAVVDAEGKVIARDLNIENMYGEKLPYRSVAQALGGRAASDVWFMHNRMMRAGAAPITVNGEVRGAVVIAYDFTAAEAREESNLLGTDLVYFVDGEVKASSFARADSAEGDGEDSAKVKQVSRLFTEKSSPVWAAKTGAKAKAGAEVGGVPREIVSLDIGGDEHLAIVGALPEAVTIVGVDLATRVLDSGKRAETIADTSEHKVGFAVLVDIEDRLEPVTSARYMSLVFGLVVLIVVLAVMWTVARHFVDAEDRLELGVNEVISGNLDYTFDSLQEFEGLANALNVMLARLLGRPEPGEEDEAEAAWRPDVLSIAELDQSAGAADIQQLAAEDEETYHARIYREYVEARRTAGLSIEGITQQDFIRKLRANEAMLRAKHKCNLVRFQVDASGGKVALRPVRLG